MGGEEKRRGDILKKFLVFFVFLIWQGTEPSGAQQICRSVSVANERTEFSLCTLRVPLVLILCYIFISSTVLTISQMFSLNSFSHLYLFARMLQLTWVINNTSIENKKRLKYTAQKSRILVDIKIVWSCQQRSHQDVCYPFKI